MTVARLSASERQARYRSRQARGLVLWPVEGSLRWLEALIAAGRLTEAEAEDKAAVALELAALIDERISLFRLDRRK